MELINRIRKSRKGFTLVEIIVVLVILAILAAFTIPSMLGFIKEARGKALIAEAREVYVAAQATATEYNGATEASLGSDAVEAENARPKVAGETLSLAQKASTQMDTYLGDDLTISDQATAATADSTDSTESFWTVDLDGTNQSKVLSVVYTKGGFTITISKDGSKIVEI
ncbi:MAG: hypothetical protein CVU99_09225 [Firmicutes bacterium HGW-Firmicutes-4]|jgi:type IV pilus assembly protein PilA|nr:MAG: hypothetical protein CVU99_09225 [Firmicutes bacterium HGW-Firmicutes-4]